MPSSLKLAELSDRELLFVLKDVGDKDGWATSAEVAEKLNLSHKHPTTCVSSRFSWLRGWGALEKDEKDGATLWRMTSVGEQFIMARLSKREADALGKLDPSKMLMVTAWLSGRYQQADKTEATLLRREWQYGDLQRKRATPRKRKR